MTLTYFGLVFCQKLCSDIQNDLISIYKTIGKTLLQLRAIEGTDLELFDEDDEDPIVISKRKFDSVLYHSFCLLNKTSFSMLA